MALIVLQYIIYISNTHEYLSVIVNYVYIYDTFQSTSLFKFSYSQADHCHYVEHCYLYLPVYLLGGTDLAVATFFISNRGLLVNFLF